MTYSESICCTDNLLDKYNASEKFIFILRLNLTVIWSGLSSDLIGSDLVWALIWSDLMKSALILRPRCEWHTPEMRGWRCFVDLNYPKITCWSSETSFSEGRRCGKRATTTAYVLTAHRKDISGSGKWKFNCSSRGGLSVEILCPMQYLQCSRGLVQHEYHCIWLMLSQMNYLSHPDKNARIHVIDLLRILISLWLC